MKNIISVKNLKKTFTSYERGHGFLEAIKSLIKRKKKSFRAVRNIDFNIKKGSIVGFIGPNGAGKSTTIKVLSGVMHPDSGKVDVMGYTPWKDRKQYVRNIGVVFGQKSQLFWDLPPVDSFYMHKSIFSLDEQEFREQLAKLVALLDIEEIMKRPTRQLSLGERMRCEFVMAMLHKPKIVFLDEPTIGLDFFAKETIRQFIKQMNKEEKITFIVTSHDLEDIEHLCDRIIIINKGTIVYDNPVKKLRVSKRKIITIKFYDRINFKKLKKIKGVKILNIISNYSVQVQVSGKEPLDIMIRRIRIGKRIEDLEVANPDITGIIKRLYKK